VLKFLANVTDVFAPMSEPIPKVLVQVQSRDGHQREAALVKMRRAPESRFLPFVIERLNDWVPNVRVAALQALEAVLQVASVDELLRSWRSVENLGHAKRADHATAIGLFQRRVALTLDELAKNQLIDGDSGLLAAFVFRGYLANGQIINVPYVMNQLCGRHARVSTIAVDWIERNANAAQRIEAIRVGQRSQHAQIRQWALRQAELLPRDESASILQEHLFESNATARNVATLKLGLTREQHLACAREKWQEPDAPFGQRLEALRLLAQHAKEEDYLLFKQEVTSPSMMVRAIASEGVLRCRPERSTQLFEVVILSLSGRALRLFVAVLLRLDIAIPRPTLVDAWTKTNEREHYLLVALAKKLGRWDAWAFVAQVTDIDGATDSNALRQLAAKLSATQVFSTPTEEQRRTILAAKEKLQLLVSHGRGRAKWGRVTSDYGWLSSIEG
jgi:hypothetical protein